MGPVEPRDITRLLKAWGDGDEAAFAELTQMLYDELHRIARRHTRNERNNNTLQTTAVVHEAYKVVGRQGHGLAGSDALSRSVRKDYPAHPGGTLHAREPPKSEVVACVEWIRLPGSISSGYCGSIVVQQRICRTR